MDNHPKMLSTLYGWYEVTDSFDAPKAFIKDMLSSHEGLLTFMRMITSNSRVSTSDERGSVVENMPRVDKKAIEDFTDFDEFIQRLRSLGESSPENKREIDNFIQAAEKDDSWPD